MFVYLHSDTPELKPENFRGGDAGVRMDRIADRTKRYNEDTIGKQKNGLMAEWLGKGLQNLVQRFESASDLTKAPL